MNSSFNPDWWKTLFDELYLLTDERSVGDEGVTRREVDMVCELLPLRAGDRILDLCGGNGRHSLELSRRGFSGCTVVDYSQPLLGVGRRAAGDSDLPVNFIRADARKTGLCPASFDHVIIMGNSLGYLPEASSDREILAEARRLLRRGGGLLLDLADGRAVKAGFQPRARHQTGAGTLVYRRRKLMGDTVLTRETVVHKKQGLIRDRTYAIRLFDSRTITALLDRSGFNGIKIRSGLSPLRKNEDYGLMKHRLLVTAEKT